MNKEIKRYTNSKNYKIVTQTVPFENNVLKFEQLYKLVDGKWLFIKDLNSELIKQENKKMNRKQKEELKAVLYFIGLMICLVLLTI